MATRRLRARRDLPSRLENRTQAGLSVRRRAIGARIASARERQSAYYPWRAGRCAESRSEKAMGGSNEGGFARRRPASRLAAFFREHRRGRLNGPAHHRQAARSLSGRDHASLRASRCGPAAPGSRDYRRDDLGGDGWQKGGRCALRQIGEQMMHKPIHANRFPCAPLGAAGARHGE